MREDLKPSDSELCITCKTGQGWTFKVSQRKREKKKYTYNFSINFQNFKKILKIISN